MPINELYHTLFMKIKQLQPTERITRIRNFTWLIVEIHQSRSGYLIRITGWYPELVEVLGDKSACQKNDIAGLRSQNVDRRNVWRFEKSRF